ncbi:MAG: AAA domain-containing protein, partial [Candidatus Thorarchaeota archaeon]
ARRPQNTEREEVILSGKLAEFRTALLQEIDAAKRSASSAAVPLINGKRIAQIGGSYQYVFDIESALNLPGDVPGELLVQGYSPLEVVIISIEGMSITLSIPKDIGTFVKSARLRSDLVFLMRKLIERIESKANNPNLVGDRLLGAPVSGEPLPIEVSYLNPQQNEALACSLGRNTTFIWGPPGTGKTRTIGAIGKQLYRRGRSVLLVSHTNIAVDGAIKQIAERLGPESEDLANGKVIRVGAPRDPSIKEIPNILLQTHVDKRSEELAERRVKLATELGQIVTEIKETSRTIDICEWLDEAEEDIITMTNDLDELKSVEVESESLQSELSQLEASSDYWITAEKSAHDAISHLNKLSRANELLSKLKHQIESNQDKLEEITNSLSNAKSLLFKVSSISWLTRKWRRLPSPEEQLAVVQNLQKQVDHSCIVIDNIRNEFDVAQKKRAFLYDKVQAFRLKYSAEPAEILQQVDYNDLNRKQLKQKINLLANEYGSAYLELESLFESRLSVLKQLGLTHESTGSLEMMLSSIKQAFQRAVEETKNVDIEKLRTRRKELNSRVRTIEVELGQIEETLKKVEQLVIADATVVATTLTRAYLRDSIQARRFDTVILDEASMAPIPALWIAASIADCNAVVVGDDKQLPPVVISEHDLAIKWLGTDIFEVANIANTKLPYKVTLEEQHRMHPDISRIPTSLIYPGILRDATENTSTDNELTEWYQVGWEHDNPVLLVDTGSLNAWVTSVPRGKRSSRLNFLSATVCVDLAEQLLLPDRPKFLNMGDPRILITCPYHPHAKLLQLLVREQKLDEEIRAGTIHSFQGSEASIVIFDMVNDDPQWRVAMFIREFDKVTKRLLNVALTRARRRLIIIGDFEYMTKLSKKSFVGSRLIPFLRDNYTCVDALNIVKAGLAAKAAKAYTAVYGGNVEPDKNRLVMTHEHFYTFLRSDLDKAKNRIVIYSAWLTQNRLSQLKLQIRSALERGVKVHVVTRPLNERSKRQLSQYRMLERELTNWGVIVVHKKRMHEKLIFIDSDIVWVCSLNSLSFSDTGEHAERRVSKQVFEEYAKTLRLNELIGEYDNGIPTCPICGSEVLAREGRNQPFLPFFWYCVRKDCGYTRSIDQPPLQDGIITCSHCGGEVEYGEWGGKPAWRCIENRHHHQKLARTHLRLPKMRAIVPKRKLRELDKHFGISFHKEPDNFEVNQDDSLLFDLE